jgi:glycosyltransferase involved in cell wall biosynthesis
MLSGTWIIVPAHNESRVISETVAELLEVCPNVVLVDDGSSDDTGARGRASGATVLTHLLNLGQGAALDTGLRFALQQAGARYFVTFDADGQHDVADAVRMVELLHESSNNIIFGTRFGGSGSTPIPRLKRVLLKLARLQVNYVSRLRLTDAHNGLRALDRRAAEAMKLTQRGMAHATEVAQIIGRNRLAYAEIPITVRYSDYSRKKGQSMLNSINILYDLHWSR